MLMMSARYEKVNVSTLNKLQALFSDSSIKYYKKGHILIFSGDSSDYFYNLVSGRIKVYDVTYRGDEIIINRFGAHSFFPMSLVLNSSLTAYIYEVEEDAMLKVIKKEKVLDFLKQDHFALLDLFSNLYHILDKSISRYVNVATKNAKARLIFSIIDECRKFAVIDKKQAYVLRVSERELAASSGLSRETVSREMILLKSQKLISSRRNTVTVPSLHTLEEYLRTHA